MGKNGSGMDWHKALIIKVFISVVGTEEEPRADDKVHVTTCQFRA